MGNTCAPAENGLQIRTTIEQDIVRLDTPTTIIRRVNIESIVQQRELDKLFWGTKEVQRWMDIMNWGRYKAMFLEKNIDGESLANVRPLTLVRDLSVAPLDAFPLFNDISPLFRSGECRVSDYDLEFRRKVDLSWMESQPEERITPEIAVRILKDFRGRDVELNDAALDYLVGLFTSQFLEFLRKPPSETEQAIIRGEDPINYPLPQKMIIIRDGQLDEEKKPVDIYIGDPISSGKVSDEQWLPIKKESLQTPKAKVCDTVQWSEEIKEPLTLEDVEKQKSDSTIGYLRDECPICLASFDEGNDLMALPCAHLFCQRCITDWLSVERSCPICQMNPDDEELTMALLDSAFVGNSMGNTETPAKGFVYESFKNLSESKEEMSPEDSPNLSDRRWQVRRDHRWVDLPLNVGRSLDTQMSQRQPMSEEVVFDEKRYEIRARERRLVDLSQRPSRTYRIRRLKGRGQGILRSESSCSLM